MDAKAPPSPDTKARRGAAEALAAVSHIIVQELDANVVAQRIADAVRGLFESQTSVLFRLDPATGDLIVLAGAGPVGTAFGNQVFPRGTGLVGLAVRERRATVTSDVLADPRLRFQPDARARIAEAGFRPVIAAPLFVKDTVIGALAIADVAGRTFDEDDVNLAQAFADLAAIALQNTRLYAESTRRRREAEELARVARMLTETLDVSEVARRVVDSVRPLFGVSSTRVRLLQPDGSLRVVAWAGITPAYATPERTQPAGLGVAGRTVAEGRPVWSSDVLADPGTRLDDDIRTAILTSGERAILGVPLRAKGQIIGALTLSDQAGRSFSWSEVSLLETFADEAALALENARLNEETQRRLQETETLLAVSRAVGSPLDLIETMRRVARETGQVLGADTVGAYVPGADGASVVPLAGYRVPKPMLEEFRRFPLPLRGHRLLEEAWASQQPAWSSDAPTDARVDAEMLRRFPHRSILALPMIVKDEPIGLLIAVWWERARAFRPAELRTVEAIASQAATVVASARLYESLARKNSHLEVLFDTARRATLTLDLAEILPQLVRSAARLIGADASTLNLLDASRTVVAPVAHHGVSATFIARGPVNATEGYAPQLVQEGRPLIIEDLAGDPLYVHRKEALAEGLRSLISVPLRSRDRIIGFLAVFSRAVRRYGDEDVALLDQFGNLSAIAIENARLHGAAVRREEELGALLRATRTVMAGLDLNVTLERIIEEAAQIAGTPHVTLLLLDKQAQVLRVGASAGSRVPRDLEVPLGTGYSGMVAMTGQPLFVADVEGDPRNLIADRDREFGIRSYLGFPIKIRDEILGVLIFNTSEPRRWSKDEMALLASFADQAAIAIQNAHLYREASRQAQRMKALADLGRLVSETLDVDVVAQRILENAGAFLDVHSPVLYRLDPGSGTLTSVSVASDLVPTLGREITWPAGAGVAGLAVRERGPVVTGNLLTDPRITLPAAMRAAIEQAPYRAVLSVPLMLKDRVIGALSLGAAADRVFDEEEIRLAQAFADQAAIALENARLYEETERGRRVAENLADVTRALSEELDPARVGQRVVDSVRALLGARSAAIYRWRPETGDLVALTTSDDTPETFYWTPVLAPGTGVAGLASAEGHPVMSPDVLRDPRLVYTPETRDRLESAAHRAVLATPLRAKDRVFGVLVVGDRTGRAFDAEEVQLAQHFADRAAIALDNARLYEETERRRHMAESLAEVRRAISQSLDPREVAQRTVDGIRGLLRARASTLFRLDTQSGDLGELAVAGDVGPTAGRKLTFPHGTGLLGLAVQARRPVVSPNVLTDPRILHAPETRARIEHAGHRSVLAIPLLVQERTIGALAVADLEGRVFTTEELELVQVFADQAALALENADLYQRAQQAYEELSRAQEQLTQSQKMEAVGRLAGGIAHDFNNLLTVVSGRTQLLLDSLGAEDPLHRHAELIMKTADRATALTQQLLAFSRKQVLQPKVFDLNAVVTNMGTMLQRLIGEDISLVLVLDGAHGYVNADPGQIEQVIMNLAVNARDAMASGGKLTIETAHATFHAAAAAPGRGLRSGAYVVLSVSDTGCGMDAETRARIFEPFFTTKGRGKGTGLGLSTVYGVVSQSNGTIEVESEPDHGATFRVYLPRVEPPAEPLAPAPAEPALPGGTETVLLVEDELEVRALAREILEAKGYRVLEAAGGEEALAVGGRHGGVIDLMVTDVVMPGMSGRELADRLGPHRPGMKVLYMSGHTDDAIVSHGVLEAGTAYLPKPFTPSGLARKVREVLGGPRAGWPAT